MNHLVSGHEVADEQEDVHHDLLSDGDDVRTSDFEDLDVLLDGGVEVDVVGAHAGSDTDLEVLCFVDKLPGEIAGVEGRRDEDLSIFDVLLEDAARALLIIRDLDRRGSVGHEGRELTSERTHDVFMALRLEPLAYAELVLDGTQKTRLLPGCFAPFVKDGEHL